MNAWNKAIAFFEQNKDVFKNARDDIGGHFLERAADYALRHIKPKAVAQIEITREANDGTGIKLKFAGELAATALTAHKGTRTTEEFIEYLIKLIRDGFENAVVSVHIICDHYLLPKIGA
ncbi:MAG TPA: hypothetical protein VGC66_02150 [Pyrinomonadaceae bacterium]